MRGPVLQFHVFYDSYPAFFLWSLAVCDIRLDFEQFTTNAPSTTLEADTSADVGGGVCQDQLTITTNTGQSIPEICGTNSGQHCNISFVIFLSYV